MPIPYAVARLNRAGPNRVLRHLTPWVPGFGVIVHRGRRSGRAYRTPVHVFPQADRYVIALIYGPGTDWVHNVLAAGECELLTVGRRVRLTAPRVYRDTARSGIRPVEKAAFGLLGVADFLEARRT